MAKRVAPQTDDVERWKIDKHNDNLFFQHYLFMFDRLNWDPLFLDIDR